MALIGSMIAPEYAHLQSSCYSNALKYFELCERDDDETNIMGLNDFQALLFIIRYELTKKHFVRAWMTLGRAVTLAQILNLHHINGVVLSNAKRNVVEIMEAYAIAHCIPISYDFHSTQRVVE